MQFLKKKKKNTVERTFYQFLSIKRIEQQQKSESADDSDDPQSSKSAV